MWMRWCGPEAGLPCSHVAALLLLRQRCCTIHTQTPAHHHLQPSFRKLLLHVWVADAALEPDTGGGGVHCKDVRHMGWEVLRATKDVEDVDLGVDLQGMGVDGCVCWVAYVEEGENTLKAFMAIGPAKLPLPFPLYLLISATLDHQFGLI
jgi:hypothetical protein